MVSSRVSSSALFLIRETASMSAVTSMGHFHWGSRMARCGSAGGRAGGGGAPRSAGASPFARGGAGGPRAGVHRSRARRRRDRRGAPRCGRGVAGLLRSSACARRSGRGPAARPAWGGAGPDGGPDTAPTAGRGRGGRPRGRSPHGCRARRRRAGVWEGRLAGGAGFSFRSAPGPAGSTGARGGGGCAAHPWAGRSAVSLCGSSPEAATTSRSGSHRAMSRSARSAPRAR